MFKTLDISTSGLMGERQRMNAIADNLANLNTTRDADGKPSPFQRRFVTFAAQSDNPADGPVGREVSGQCRHHDSAAARVRTR